MVSCGVEKYRNVSTPRERVLGIAGNPQRGNSEKMRMSEYFRTAKGQSPFEQEKIMTKPRRLKKFSCFLGIGSNQGNRLHSIQDAIALLKAVPQIRVTAISSILHSEAHTWFPQASYYNCVIEIHTSLTPLTLLDILKGFEQKMGRKQTCIVWGPRIIDIDILFYGDFSIKEERLIIPHPRIAERWFVVRPLHEIAPLHFYFQSHTV